MKHIRISALIILVAAGMSSCSVSQTMTRRTARSLEIESEILQMPTVVDLVVDTVFAKADTSWTNIPFKNTTTKAAMRNVLIGEILEQTKADVLVQPREHVINKIYHPLKQGYQMEVIGYPARYRNFRTASEEDLRILNGLDPEPINYNTIFIGAGAIGGQPVREANTQQITQPQQQPKRNKKPPYVRNKTMGTIELGANLAFCDLHGLWPGLVVNYTQRWKAKNPNIYQGIGVGLNTAFGKWDTDNDAREWFIPIYYAPRFYFGQRKVIPFFDFRIGAFLGVDEYNHRNNWKDKETNFMGGLYYGGFFGLAFGKHVDIAFGTDGFFGGKVKDEMTYTPTATFKLGISF